MKKDEAVFRRERVLAALNQALADLSVAPLTDDGRLYHDEIDGENRWAQRLSRSGAWPHVPAGPGVVAMPGLRYEVWYFQKRPEAWLALLCSRQGPALQLANALKPGWKEWIESGKYARRYQPLEATWRRAYPDTEGIWRSVPTDDKLDRGLLQLVRDTLPILEKVVPEIDPASDLAARFSQANAARDRLAELAAHFKR